MGMGGSERLPFPKRSYVQDLLWSDSSNTYSSFLSSIVRQYLFHDDSANNSEAATNFFLDSLEELRISLRVENFTLAGHSLGGYLCAKYTLKYPTEVKALVLISPVGLPAPPNIGDDNKDSPGNLHVSRHDTHTAAEGVESHHRQSPPVSTYHNASSSLPFSTWLFVNLWKYNYTPQMILRAIGTYSNTYSVLTQY